MRPGCKIFRNVVSPLMAAMCLSKPAVGGSDEVRFQGICDISAAARLTDDTIVAASDEENALFVFSRSGGPPVAHRELGALLGLPDHAEEIDIEAAARDGDRIWWIGSHQPFKPMRQMIFATNVPALDLNDLRIVVPPFDLTSLIRSYPKKQDLWHPNTWLFDPEDGGFNIEAAAMSADGDLLIGLRSPLDGPSGTEGSAIVVSLDVHREPKIAGVYRLDLGNQGLRGMARQGPRILLIAGGLGDGGSPQLFEWLPGTPVAQLRHAYLGDVQPESLVVGSKELMVFSDDGNRLKITARDEMVKCKALARSTIDLRPNSVSTRAIVLATQ